MRKEVYKVLCPKHIMFGAPSYFEDFKGAQRKKLTVDYRPPKHFDCARLVLKEEENQEYPEYIERSMTLYLSPHDEIETYTEGMKYRSQELAEKMIGVDRCCYYLKVDDQEAAITTTGDGWWGNFDELYRRDGKTRISDCVMIEIAMPEDQDFNDMKRMAEYFFKDMEPLIPKKQKKKEAPTR